MDLLGRRELKKRADRRRLVRIPRDAHQRGVALQFIRPGNPVENAYIESFNGRFRDECLNSEWFMDLTDAQRAIDRWRRDYNEARPHRGLAGRTPEQSVRELQQRQLLNPFTPATHSLTGPALGRRQRIELFRDNVFVSHKISRVTSGTFTGKVKPGSGIAIPTRMGSPAMGLPDPIRSSRSVPASAVSSSSVWACNPIAVAISRAVIVRPIVPRSFTGLDPLEPPNGSVHLGDADHPGTRLAAPEARSPTRLAASVLGYLVSQRLLALVART